MKITVAIAALAAGLTLIAPAAQAQPAPVSSAQLYLTGFQVADLKRSVDFYTKAIGLKEVGRYGNGETFAEVVLKSPADTGGNLVLVWSKDKPGPFDMGNGWGRIGVQTPNAAELVERVRAAGGKVTREPRTYAGNGAILAFVTDPDGYAIEVIQSPPAR